MTVTYWAKDEFGEMLITFDNVELTGEYPIGCYTRGGKTKYAWLFLDGYSWINKDTRVYAIMDERCSYQFVNMLPTKMFFRLMSSI